jgi:RNA recognition motif-containing protein
LHNYNPQLFIAKVDRNTGRSRCFGFITFRDTHDCKALLQAVSQEPCVIDNKPVEVKLAKAKVFTPPSSSSSSTSSSRNGNNAGNTQGWDRPHE